MIVQHVSKTEEEGVLMLILRWKFLQREAERKYLLDERVTRKRTKSYFSFSIEKKLANNNFFRPQAQ